MQANIVQEPLSCPIYMSKRVPLPRATLGKGLYPGQPLPPPPPGTLYLVTESVFLCLVTSQRTFDFWTVMICKFLRENRDIDL